jgi:PTH1 family peptidyl-tRNA hydrolase
LIVDQFRKKERFPRFKISKKFKSLISRGKINKKKIILAKPQTFMNESGKAVKSLIGGYNLELKNLIVIHDDFDLPFGKIRISFGRGSAGHKGVQSIIDELGTKDFIRFRIGIKPKNYTFKNLERFVLQKFNKKEEKILKEVIEKTCQAIEVAIIEGIEKAMSKFN